MIKIPPRYSDEVFWLALVIGCMQRARVGLDGKNSIFTAREKTERAVPMLRERGADEFNKAIYSLPSSVLTSKSAPLSAMNQAVAVYIRWSFHPSICIFASAPNLSSTEPLQIPTTLPSPLHVGRTRRRQLHFRNQHRNPTICTAKHLSGLGRLMRKVT